MATGTLFFHFNSKEELIHVLFYEVRLKVIEKVLQGISEQMPIRKRFFKAFSELLRYFLQNPEEFKFIEQYHFSPLSLYENRRAEKDGLRDLLLEARDFGFIKNLPPLLLESLAYGPISFLAKEHANCGTVVDEDVISRTVEAIWKGLEI